MQAVVGDLKNTFFFPPWERLMIFAHPGGRPSSVTDRTVGSAFHSSIVVPREERLSGATRIFPGGIWVA